MSWEDVDKEEKLEKPTTEQVDKFASLCHSIFVQTVDGQELLELLKKHLMSSVCSPEQEACWGYFREGQNSLIRQFLHAIDYQNNKIKGGK